MGVHVIHFRLNGHARWGVIANGLITPIAGHYPTTGDFLRMHSAESLKDYSEPDQDKAGNSLLERDIELLSPVTGNQQFICQGANYRQHMIESGMNPDVKSYNMIFTKAASCMCAATADLIYPTDVRFLDYEIELGLLLRRDITGKVSVTDANLHEFIAGAVIVNDYSARDIQIPQTQFYKGKSYRRFGPIGPYLYLLSPADIPQLKSLDLNLSVNGEIRQKDNTRHLVYGPAETLAELSGVQDLLTGDLLSTGTPAGCALSVPSPAKQRIGALLPERKKWKIFFNTQSRRTQYLKVGDVVEARITSADGSINLGVQRNRVVAPT